MSASKYADKQQSIVYKQDQLGDIERLKSICFPKTPKSSSNQQNNSSVLLNSGGKFGSSKMNYFSKQSQIVQFNGSASSPTQTQKRKQLNRSMDNGSAFFGKENEGNYEDQQFNDYANNSGNMHGSNRKRQTLRNISQNQFNNANNEITDDQNYPRKRSEKKNFIYNSRNVISSNSNQNIQKGAEQHFDYFEPTTRSIQIDNANHSGLLLPVISNTNALRRLQVVETPIQPSNIMKDMVEFIRKVGCELNDLCLTKMSEKTLQTMIEKHLFDVGRMQQLFSESLRDKEPNITLALNVISKCFEELVEKLGDLITRLRMFNKRKFKNLVEQSLTSTLKEVFEENNKLNILEIITDINVFVNQQRKSLYFWRLSSLVEQTKHKHKSFAFFSIMDTSRQKKQETILNVEKQKLKLSKALLIPQNIIKSKMKQAFYKWHFCKQIKKQIEGQTIEAISRLDVLCKNVQRQNKRDGFVQIVKNLREFQLKQKQFQKFLFIVKSKILKNKQYGFDSLKKNQFALKMNKNESIQRIKALFLIKYLEKVEQKKEQDAFRAIISHTQRKYRKLTGINKLANLFEMRKKSMFVKFMCNIAHIRKQNRLTDKFRGVILSKLVQRVFQVRVQETFNYMKTELFVRSQPIKLVFKAVHEALDKIENPTLRNLLRTIDVCFSNKKITKHLQNLRQIQFVIVNMNSKEITQLNPIWKKLENVQLENEQAYYINQVINKENSFEDGSEMLNYPIISTNLSSRDNKCVQTILSPLNLDANSNQYLACETVCSYKMNEQMEQKIVKISRVIKSKLKENFLREKLHMNNCRNIMERHMRQNTQKYYSVWKQSIYERLITEKDQNSVKANDLEKQLLSYKVELDKNKVHSSNIMKELGVKRDEVIEIETRLEDLTIEKKAKSKCLATSLFANYIEKRETKIEQIKRSFTKWVDFMLQKRIATVACQQIEEINSKHIETRFSSAMYLLKHFQDSYQRRLKIYTLKYLAYNSVCNNSQLNFSQFNNNINRSSTPTTLSPNINMSKKKRNNQSLSQNSLMAGVNTLEVQNYNGNNMMQPSLSDISQNHGQSESNLQLHNQQQPQIQGQASIFETPLPSPLNSNLSQSMLQDTKQKPFFSSAGGNKSNIKNPLANISNGKNPNQSMIMQQQQQQQQQPQQQKQTFGFNQRDSSSNSNNNNNNHQQHHYQQQNLFMRKNDSSQNIQLLTDDSTTQPPIQLQPTQITNPLMSNTSRTGNNNTSSTSSLVNLSQPQQYQQGQHHSLTSQKFNPRNQQQQQWQQNYSQGQHDNIFIQQQQPDSRSSNSNSILHNSFNNFYRPPLHTQDLFDSSQQNIQTGNSSTYRGVGLNKSFSGYNSMSQSNTINNSSIQNIKQPSNLGYRLSAKTINFLQKFGRNSSTENNPVGGGNVMFGNTSSSSASHRMMMTNSQIQNNYNSRNKSANQDFQSVSSRHGDHEGSFYKKY